MPKFVYRIINKENRIIRGTITAPSKNVAHKRLSKEGKTVLFVSKESPLRISIYIPFISKNFSKTERVYFLRNLSTMLASGLSLADALRTLEQQSKSTRLKKVLLSIIGDIQNGQKLSNTLAKYPKYFPKFLVESIRIGEISGQLNDTLDRLSDDLERQQELESKIKEQMAYPVIVILFMLVVLVGLVVFVLPKIAALYEEIGVPLPLITRSILGVKDFLSAYPLQILLVIFLFASGFTMALRTKRGHYIFNRTLLKMPIFGPIIKEFNLATFFRSLQSLISSGAQLMTAVDITKNTISNDVYREALKTARPLLSHGVPLSGVLEHFPALFPLQLRRIIEVGERSGRLDESFTRLTDYYDRAVRHRAQIMTSLLEPLLIIGVGIVVMLIALSIFLPIYETSFHIV